MNKAIDTNHLDHAAMLLCRAAFAGEGLAS